MNWLKNLFRRIIDFIRRLFGSRGRATQLNTVVSIRPKTKTARRTVMQQDLTLNEVLVIGATPSDNEGKPAEMEKGTFGAVPGFLNGDGQFLPFQAGDNPPIGTGVIIKDGEANAGGVFEYVAECTPILAGSCKLLIGGDADLGAGVVRLEQILDVTVHSALATNLGLAISVRPK